MYTPCADHVHSMHALCVCAMCTSMLCVSYFVSHVHTMCMTCHVYPLCMQCAFQGYSTCVLCAFHANAMCTQGRVYAMGITCVLHVNALCMPCRCHVYLQCAQVCSMSMPSCCFIFTLDRETAAGHAKSHVQLPLAMSESSAVPPAQPSANCNA